MTIRDLLKRTPFRLAATFSLFFITTVLALFVVIYIGASARLVSDIRARVQTTLNSLALLDTDNGIRQPHQRRRRRSRIRP